MPRRFSIEVRRENDVLRLDLSGQFDRTSARRVVDLLGRSDNGIRRICIDTSRLEHPNPLELILSEWSHPGFSLLCRNESADKKPA